MSSARDATIYRRHSRAQHISHILIAPFSRSPRARRTRPTPRQARRAQRKRRTAAAPQRRFSGARLPRSFRRAPRWRSSKAIRARQSRSPSGCAFPNGYKIPPHTHPTTENVTVLAGTFLAGMGTQFDESELQALGRDAFVSIPAEARALRDGARADGRAGPRHRSVRAHVREPRRHAEAAMTPELGIQATDRRLSISS